jgi:hypothetical protein
MTDRERARAIADTHTWVGAATIPLSAAQARTADLRAALTIPAATKVQVLDAYCSACRRNWEACADEPCPAVDSRSNGHLRGGPIGERKKRGRLQRDGTEGVTAGPNEEAQAS